MSAVRQTIIINGREYDAITGEAMGPATSHIPANRPASGGRVMDFTPVKNSAKIKPAVTRGTPTHHKAVHHNPEHSKTLNRLAAKKPAAETARHVIKKFAHSAPLTHSSRPETPILPARETPHLSKPERKPIQPKATSSKEFKEQLFKEGLAQAPAHRAKPHKKPSHSRLKTRWKNSSRGWQVAMAVLAVLVLGAYFAYLNMPNLSLRVAASRAGVANASFPDYHPDGYRFVGPVAYSPGQVSVRFASNSSDKNYSVTQRASNWDSAAVLDNYVDQNTKNYLTYNQQGLTIYTFGNQAAWVNHGVFYTVNGNAPLSSDQVLKIAASL